MEVGETLEWDLKDADSINAISSSLKNKGYLFKRKTTETGYQVTRIK